MININLPEITEMKLYFPDELSNEEGIYFIRNLQNEVIYIGKSKNIKQRVHTHFLNNSPIKDKNEIVFVSYVPYSLYNCKSEGVEMIYIDKYNPKYNNIKQLEPCELISAELDRQLTAHVPMR